MKNLLSNNFIKQSLIALVIVTLFTIGFITLFHSVEEPLNPFFIEAFHNILFLAFSISFVYTIYIGICTYFHFLRELKRGEILKNLVNIPYPEFLLTKLLQYSIVTATLYTLRSYIYEYIGIY